MAISKIKTNSISDDAITAAKIADGTIVAADLAANSVDSSELVDGGVDNSHMSVNSIDSDQYVDASIDVAHMSVNSIDSDQYVDGSIDNAHIADDQIGSEHYAAGSVDTTALGADAVTAAKIADDVVNSEHYAAASIDNEHLADNAADTAEIADNAITLAKMASGTDGNIITYDASGNPAAVATGSSGQLLTSAGAGAPPTFTTVSGFSVSSITGATALGATPADTDEFVLSDAGTLKRVDFSHIKSSNSPSFLAVPTGSHALMPRNTSSKILFNAEELDTDNCFDTSTSVWTPTTAGKYFVFAKLKLSTGNDSSNFIIRLYKSDDNSSNNQIADANYGNTWYNSTSIHRIIDMDGDDDNIAVWRYHGAQNGSGSPLDWVARECWFGAFKIIGA